MPLYPDINGLRFDFSSVSFSFSALPLNPVVGVQAIDYKYKLQPGEVRGTAPQVIGRTRGKYESDCTVTLFKAEEDLLIGAVEGIAAVSGALGFMEQPFDITVVYADYLQAPITDQIVGARIMTVTQGHKSGADALVSKVEMNTMYVLPNNRVPYSGFLGL